MFIIKRDVRQTPLLVRNENGLNNYYNDVTLYSLCNVLLVEEFSQHKQRFLKFSEKTV